MFFPVERVKENPVAFPGPRQTSCCRAQIVVFIAVELCGRFIFVSLVRDVQEIVTDYTAGGSKVFEDNVWTQASSPD